MHTTTKARVANVQKKSWLRNATKKPRMAGTRAAANPATRPARKHVMPAATASGDIGMNRKEIHATMAISPAIAATTVIGSREIASCRAGGLAGSSAAIKVMTVVIARMTATDE